MVDQVGMVKWPISPVSSMEAVEATSEWEDGEPVGETDVHVYVL